MKNPFKKAFIFLLTLAVILSLACCDIAKPDEGNNQTGNVGGKTENQENGENNDLPGKNPTGNPDARYWGNLALESYEDMLLGRNTLKSKDPDGFVESFYSFDDSIGENFKTVYYFSAPGAWITYPITAEDYFNSVYDPFFTTYVFITGSDKCQCEGCKDSDRHQPFAEVPEEFSDLSEYPYFTITKDPSIQNSQEIIEIANPEGLEFSYKAPYKETHVYEFSYEGTPVFKIESCVELSAEMLDLIIEHIVTLN